MSSEWLQAIQYLCTVFQKNQWNESVELLATT